jgi:hypothetical protein
MHVHPFLLHLLLSAIAASAQAAGTVRLELVGDLRGSAMAFQDWAEALGKAGIQNVRIRAVEDSDNVGVKTEGTADSPIYVVTGIVRSRDELLMPNGKFRRSEVNRLAEWVNDLAQHGPTDGKERTAAFGLTSAQFDQVRADLATPVGFVTQGVPCREVVQKIAGRLKQSLELDAESASALADEKVADELINLSCGTALAYVLRPAGYGLLPRTADGKVSCAVIRASVDLKVWPVGWPSDTTPHKALPALFEFLNVNVENVSAAVALDAIAQRIKTPVLFDHNALAKHKIDPSKTTVSLPKSRTTYSLALRKLLFKAGMKFEVRQDEAGTPFLWITSTKP